MRICGATNYEGHTLSEIKRDFKKICYHSKGAISLTKKIDWVKLPMDLASIFADITGLAQRIKEEKSKNFLFLFGRSPSKQFVSALSDLGRRGIYLHRQIGEIWHRGNYYSRYDINSLETTLYSELRDFCCWAMDLDNIGFELNKRFSNMEINNNNNNSGIVAGGSITAGGDIIVHSEKNTKMIKSAENKSWYEKPLGIIILGIILAGIVYFLGWN